MTPNPCERQGYHVFFPGELGILRVGDRCACGAATWETVTDLVTKQPAPRAVRLLAHRSNGRSSVQQQRNKDAAELLSQAVPSGTWEESFIVNLTDWIDTGKPVTERQLDCLRRVVDGGYEHYTDTKGYF